MNIKRSKQVWHRIWIVGLLCGLMFYPSVYSWGASLDGGSHAAQSEREPLTFAPLVKETEPSVVMIRATIHVANTPDLQQLIPGLPLGDLFKQFQIPPGAVPKTRKEFSLGSGFIVDPSGIIVTNYHVIKGAEKIVVQLNEDSKDYKAKVIGADESTDIAVLKIKASKALPALQWANSSSAQVGDRVLAIGNPIGLGGTVTAGIISAQGRSLSANPYDNFIQTDAAINKGNSGGPLIDMKGHVLGINTAIYSPDGGSIGIGFAIPSDQAKNIVNELVKNGKIERGWIGVMIQPVTNDIAKSLGMSKAEGALVVRADKHGPAAKGGIKQGDVILKFDGHVVPKSQKLPEIVASSKINTKVPVDVWRKGRVVHLSLYVQSKKEQKKQMPHGKKHSKHSSANMSRVLGLTLQSLTPAIKEQYGLSRMQTGVIIVNVDSNSEAFDMGIRPGDIIVSINQIPVSTLIDVAKIVSKKGKGPYLFLLERGGQQYYVALKRGDE